MRSPRLNCFGVEEERDPAEGFTGVDLHGAAPGDGGELGTTAAMEELGRKRKEEQGGMEWAGRHGPPSPPEATAACGMGTGGGGGIVPVAMVATVTTIF